MSKRYQNINDIPDNEETLEVAEMTARNLGCDHLLKEGRTPKKTATDILYCLWNAHSEAMSEDEAHDGILAEFDFMYDLFEEKRNGNV